jgi:predicted amidohydrolase YtcJ
MLVNESVETAHFENARIFTGSGFGAPTTLSVAAGRVVEPQAWGVGEGPRVIDLEGRFVMPGFIESHAHPGQLGLSLKELDLRPSNVSSVADIVELVAATAKTAPPGSWIRGTGWDETYLEEGRGPTRQDLDAASPDHPVTLTRTCQHMRVVNSPALRLSGIHDSTADPAGGRLVRDATGEMTGLVQEAAMDLIASPPYTVHDYDEAVHLAQKAFISWGITTAHDLSTTADHLRSYTRANRDKQLKIRIRPWLWALDQSGMSGVLEHALQTGLTTGFGDDRLRIQGAKFTLDGSVGGRTAAVCCAFTDTEDTGMLYLDNDDLVSHLKRATEGGFRVAIHGIGERALDQALEALKRIDPEFVKNNRNRIEHCALPSTTHLEQMKEKNLIAASSIAFLYHLGDSYLKALGKERVKRAYPQRTFLDYGIVAPGNSDTPVTNGNPWEGIYAAVTRTTLSGTVLDDNENVTLEEAIRAYTTDAAYASFEEHSLGSLVPGAHADFQVLEKNPFDCEPEEWLQLSPTSVYSAGVRVDAEA